MKIKVKQMDGLAFAGLSESGHWSVLDTVPRLGGFDGASRPMEFILIGLAGCTGMDVASILKKMQVELDGFEIEVVAEQAEDHPRVFTKISMKYIFFGKEIAKEKVERAIELSQTKYCPVTAMLRKSVEIETSCQINPE